MTESRLFKAWGQGCARSLVIRIIVAVFVVGGFLCVTLATALLPIDQDIKIFIWVGLIVIFMATIITGVFVWGILHIRKTAAELDQVFTPLGLEGRMYLLNGRHYHGIYHGYPIHAYFSRGPTLEIYLEASLKTRVGIGRKGAIEKAAASILDKTPLQIEDPAFEHLVIYPLDHNWTANLLADHSVRESVLQLTSEGSATEIRSISVTPEALKFEIRFIHTSHITQESVRAWVNELNRLVRIAESLPPPTVSTEETSLETTNRRNRGKFFWPIIGITCGFFAVLSICILAITALLIMLEESGV